MINKIIAECKPYVDELLTMPRGLMLIRGTSDKIIEFKRYESLKFREPKDTLSRAHEELNFRFNEAFGWNVRNGVLCYGCELNKYKKPRELYGKNYLLFPIGNFDFVYSPEIFDLFISLNLHEAKLDTVVKSKNYKNDDLHTAMISRQAESSDLSNEISIRVDSYYLVDMKYKDDIINLIWGKV